MNRSRNPKNWFTHISGAYARFRPDYPPELAALLAEAAPSRAYAVDVGCGSGQLTRQLGAFFDVVVGVDPGAAGIAGALPCPGVHYVCASAERLPVADHCADLITAAQAAHWFDLPAFYAEVRRIASPRALLALVAYGAPRFEGPLQEVFRRFHDTRIAAWWPPERRHVDTGYRDLDFPFDELPAPEMSIRREWTLGEFIGYVSTWSALQSAGDAGWAGLSEDLGRSLRDAWGDPGLTRSVSWPVSLRLGRL